MDSNGKINIRPYMEQLNICLKDNVIFIPKDDVLHIKKVHLICTICNQKVNAVEKFRGKNICKKCIEELKMKADFI